MNFQSRWVLVTGASSGLGREIARDLAVRHRANLVIVARRLGRLEELAGELRAAAGVEVVPIAADLSIEQDVENLFAQATDGRDIYGVVLNAGITHFGEQTKLEWPRFKAMLATNVTSLVHLVHLFLPYLIEQQQEGGILLVSSMASLVPVPFQSAYSG
ncbi:MAG: SDR family NAD(P)-dependent oxidoreductase, partial [Nannocystaceae bacterium]